MARPKEWPAQWPFPTYKGQPFKPAPVPRPAPKPFEQGLF